MNRKYRLNKGVRIADENYDGKIDNKDVWMSIYKNLLSYK